MLHNVPECSNQYEGRFAGSKIKGEENIMLTTKRQRTDRERQRAVMEQQLAQIKDEHTFLQQRKVLIEQRLALL